MNDASSRRKLIVSELRLEFERDANGRTFLSRQFAGYPFHICRAQYQDPSRPGMATLYIQSCAGGLYEHDRLRADIIAHPFTEMHITSQAATIVHSMEGGVAKHEAALVVSDGAYLEYLPDPQILFPFSRFASTITVRMAGNGCALISDSFLHHDPAGLSQPLSWLRSQIIVEDESGKRLAIDRIHLDGRLAAEKHVGIAGTYSAQATMIIAGTGSLAETLLASLRRVELPYTSAACGVSCLPNSAGLVIRILAVDGIALKSIMRSFWCGSRLAIKGDAPSPRRK